MPDDDSDGKAVFAPKSEKSANKKSKQDVFNMDKDQQAKQVKLA